MKNILNRKNIFSSNSFALILLILAILIVLNLLSANHFGRLDLTAEKQYSVSQATKNTLKEIDDPLFIKVYFSEKLPPDLAHVSLFVKDILSEYRSYSKNIRVEFIDPTKDPEIENEVRAMGIPPVEMQVLEKDEFKVQKGYLGLGLFFEDNTEIIPVIENTLNLEYDLTSAIKRLTATSLKTIGFLTGHEEHGISDLPYMSADQTQVNNYIGVKKSLDKNYQVKTVDNISDKSITEIDSLIIAGPKTAFNEKELYHIDQFIMNGGQVIFLLDPVQITEGLQAEISQTGLEKLIEHYGIKVNQDFAIDSNNENVAFSSGYMQFLLPYPLWPRLIKDNFLTDNPVMAKLQSLSFPWVSSLTANDKENIELSTWATTSANGGSISEPFNLDPQQNFKPTSREKTAIVMEAKGQFASYFANKDVSEIGTADLEDATFSPITEEQGEMVLQSPEDTQIIVIADSDFISDDYLSRFPDNLTFFLNAVDYLTLDSDLISIRSKTILNRPLDETSDGLKTSLKVINIIIVPLIIIIIGVIRFYLRKRNK
ncbi:GldG family protein [Patescibacteria group bacterium]